MLSGAGLKAARASLEIKNVSRTIQLPLSRYIGDYTAKASEGENGGREGNAKSPDEISDLEAIFKDIPSEQVKRWSDGGEEERVAGTSSARSRREDGYRGGSDMGDEAESSYSVLQRLTGSAGRNVPPRAAGNTYSSFGHTQMNPQSTPPRRNHLPYTASPRPPHKSRSMKGVHSRYQRRLGQTPQEAMRFQETLREIFEDLSLSDSFMNRSSSSIDPFGTRSPAIFGSSGFLRRPDGRKRLLLEDTMDDAFVEELDRFKEECTTISTDLELLEFAQQKVFIQEPQTPTESLLRKPVTTTSESNVTQAMGYPRTYPHMISHIMKIARNNYNNPHLALAFFQYAQTRSLESYLLGCLSSAYNELMRTRWECFRDLDGIDTAVKEMEMNGVGWDKDTRKIVSQVIEEVGTDVLDNGTGRWGESVYDLLGRLERKVQKDIRDQEFYLEYKSDQKRRARAAATADNLEVGPNDSRDPDQAIMASL